MQSYHIFSDCALINGAIYFGLSVVCVFIIMAFAGLSVVAERKVCA